MFVFTIRRGEATELVACSSDKSKLQAKMKAEVESFIDEVYGNDEEAFEWLKPVTDGMDFWSDEDDEYETVFQITEVEEI